MTRKEAIDKVYGMSGTKEQHEALDFLVPEIRELREFYDRQQEDERIRKWIVKFLVEQYPECWKDKKNKMLAYLEKQKEQNLIMANSPQLKEQKPEWSEEDRNTLLMAATVLKANFDSDEKFKGCDYDCETLAGKLLEMRYRISPSWKPSDEQLRPLEYAIDYFKKKRNDTTYLESLYNDLKKL